MLSMGIFVGAMIVNGSVLLAALLWAVGQNCDTLSIKPKDSSKFAVQEAVTLERGGRRVEAS